MGAGRVNNWLAIEEGDQPPPERTFLPSEMNEYVEVGGTEQIHDANGNLTLASTAKGT